MSLADIWLDGLAAFYIGKASYQDEGECFSWTTFRGYQQPMLMNVDMSPLSSRDIKAMGGIAIWLDHFDLCLDARQVENSLQVY